MSLAQEFIHHWVIETAQDASSPGTCKKCGADKRFPNSIDTRVVPTKGPVTQRKFK